MMCHWCRAIPRKLRDFGKTRLMVIADRSLGARDCRIEEQDWICQDCLEALHRCRDERIALGRSRAEDDEGRSEKTCTQEK